MNDAMKQALEALQAIKNHLDTDEYAYEKADAVIPVLEKALQNDPAKRLARIMGTFDLATGYGETLDELLDSLESELSDVLGYYRQALTDADTLADFTEWAHAFIAQRAKK